MNALNSVLHRLNSEFHKEMLILITRTWYHVLDDSFKCNNSQHFGIDQSASRDMVIETLSLDE